MSARYWILVSDELMDSDPSWLDVGLHPIEPANYEHPGMRWWLFEDDGAPEDLDGKKVDLVISRMVYADGSTRPQITERRLVG